MIVENEIILAIELEQKLTEMGYEIIGRVVSGKEAVDMAIDLKPDMIIMDIRLEDELDGIEAAEKIRKTKPIPIIYLTAYADDRTLQRAKLTEPYGYLVKPYSEVELRTSIEMALHKAQMEQQLRESEERFRVIFDSAEDWIFIKDYSLRYTHVNSSMLRLLKRTSEQIIGKTDDEVMGMEEGKLSREVEDRVLRGQTVEMEHTTKFGGSVVTWDLIRTPLRDGDGRIYGLCGIGRNVTERKKMERLDTNGSYAVDPIEYPSESIKSTVKYINLAAKTDSICLFLGESGSGKDHLARYLHDMSQRKGGPFFNINCAALISDLAESELFGHESGAFTGASSRKRGLLELAEGGTLLLNEIGELPLPLQAKLLAFLDTNEFTRVGGEKRVSVNARLITATNKDLESEVNKGTFRADLYYRLSVMIIKVPPLRERIDDIPILVQDLLGSLTKKMGLKNRPTLDDEAMAKLLSYNWPGNVRELRNALERALIRRAGPRITASQLAIDSKELSPDKQMGELSITLNHTPGASINDLISDAKRFMVTEALRKKGGSVKEASRYLGLTRDALNYLIRTLEIRK
jgi:PAS domain S-box-containing protein